LNALERIHRSNISVTDIAAQYWCEKQMELNHVHGARITKEIREGRAMHEHMENVVNEQITLQPKSYPDSLFKNLYSSYKAFEALARQGKTREIQIYGSLGGFRVVGKLDELDRKDGETVIVEDKTRSTDSMPMEAQLLTHRVQVLIYKRLLEDIRSGAYTADNFKRSYGVGTLKLSPEFIRQLDTTGIEKPMQNIGAMADALFRTAVRIDKISETLCIRYTNQHTDKQINLYKFKYDESETQEIIKYIMKYWRGDREAQPVPEAEKYKCNWCVFFGKECKVWWSQSKL
jgi:exonuclease V